MSNWKSVEIIKGESHPHVVEVRLVGPGKNNTMGPEFWDEMSGVFAELDADADVRAIVITGSGRNFSYGLDLTTSGSILAPFLGETPALAAPRTDLRERIRHMQGAISAVADCRTPVIAAIQGRCIGGAVDLITAVDIRYASADATFSVREIKVGMVADVGTLARLPFIIGDGHMRELTLTGRDIDAARAERIGLVNDVVETPEELRDLAFATAAEIADNPPLVTRGIKEVIDLPRAAAVDASLRYVAAWNSAFLPSFDIVEAVGAVFEKRKPEFKGH